MRSSTPTHGKWYEHYCGSLSNWSIINVRFRHAAYTNTFRAHFRHTCSERSGHKKMRTSIEGILEQIYNISNWNRKTNARLISINVDSTKFSLTKWLRSRAHCQVMHLFGINRWISILDTMGRRKIMPCSDFTRTKMLIVTNWSICLRSYDYVQNFFMCNGLSC